MRKIITFFTALLFGLTVTATEMGVIEVSLQYAATIEFNKNVTQPVYGYNPMKGTIPTADGQGVIPVFENYNHTIAGKNIIIRASRKDIAETTITIILEDNSVFTGIIRYKENPEKHYYNFTGTENKANSETNKNQNQKNDLITERLNELLLEKNPYSFATYNANIFFVVTNIKNDEKYTYMKLDIINKSASVYKIKGTIFKYNEKKKRKLKKGEVKNTEHIMPIKSMYPEGMEIPANTTETLGFVLPLYSTGENGKLAIQIVEENGTRNADIELSANELAKIGVFQ